MMRDGVQIMGRKDEALGRTIFANGAIQPTHGAIHLLGILSRGWFVE